MSTRNPARASSEIGIRVTGIGAVDWRKIEVRLQFGELLRTPESYGFRPLKTMIDLRYSLVIEATAEPDFFSFYSPDLEGFSGVGHSVEDCLYQAKWGMTDHVRLLEEEGLPVPLPNARPRITIENAPALRQAG
jgi:predicted RNase H-like HicB family nuclease